LLQAKLPFLAFFGGIEIMLHGMEQMLQKVEKQNIGLV